MSKKWKIVLLLFFSVLVILIAAGAFLRMNTKKHSPVETITFNKNGLQLETVYCRPYKKGRLIFGTVDDGALQPYGVYWRLGANEATTFELNKTVSFASQTLKPGKYSIYAVPGKSSFKIGINTEANRWGFAEPDYSQDVLNVTLPVTQVENIIEQLTLSFYETEAGADLVIQWENSQLKIPIAQQ